MNSNKPLRLKAGIIIVVLQLLLRYALPLIAPGTSAIGALGGIAGSLAIIVWWAFFSHAPRVERWSAVFIMIATLIAISQLIDVSIATGGQGMMYYIFALPTLTISFVIWALVTQKMSNNTRRITMIATIILSCGIWTLFRIDGITGEFNLELAWRWSETHEDQLLAKRNEALNIISDSTLTESKPEWPGFRGPNRDGIVYKSKIKTDWNTRPPKEIWRKQIGPGCSSFAVHGDVIYTQEQRGEYEIVSCYKISTGDPVWKHSDSTRFWDSHAGAGPRSTPTLCNGKVYAMGATGLLNVLNANDGSLVWSRNTAPDNEVKHSGWGYTSSPLVVDSLVIVAVVGKLAAYNIKSGKPIWFGPDGGDSYSSPHLYEIDGVKQVLLMSANGVYSFSPGNGDILWEYVWEGGSRIVQPAMTENGDILVSKGDGGGLRRITVTKKSKSWLIEEFWTSSMIKPNFNDFVVHKGYAYGYVGPSLACINLENGERRWKNGRYGGQLLLLADQDLLIILSEKGELVLVSASDEFNELAKIPAIKGRTWNHPVLVNNTLLVRNTQEMVAYNLN